MEGCISLMEIYTRVSLIRIVLMDMVFILSLTVIDIKVNFWKDCNMDVESILMLELVIMMENGRMGGKKVKGK
jgi:hypothetical protein